MATIKQRRKSPIKYLHPYSKAVELYQDIWFYIKFPVSAEYYESNKNRAVEEVKGIVVSMRAINPALPKIDFTDLYGALEWCIEADQIELGAKSQLSTSKVKMKLRFVLAEQSYKETLELAKKNGKVWTGGDREIYDYGKENLPDYGWPKFESWQGYRSKHQKLLNTNSKYPDK